MFPEARSAQMSLACAVSLCLILHPREPRVVVGELIQVSERDLPVTTGSLLVTSVAGS